MPDRSRKKRPADPNELAAQVVAESTREEPEPSEDEGRRAAAVLGRLGGKKGGLARAAKLTPKRRSQIARKAARARWAQKHAAAGEPPSRDL